MRGPRRRGQWGWADTLERTCLRRRRVWLAGVARARRAPGRPAVVRTRAWRRKLFARLAAGQTCPGAGCRARLSVADADRIRVLLADDQGLMREGLRALLALPPGLRGVAG